MIFEALLTPIFFIIESLISFFPTPLTIPDWGIACIDLISKGLSLFPPDVWWTCIGNVAFWMYLQLGWAIIEWIYKKLPGIN